MPMKTKNLLTTMALTLTLLLAGKVGWGQISISPGNTVNENFNSIGTSETATLPVNWKVDKNTSVRTIGAYSSALTQTERSAGDNMSNSASNGIYNFAAGDPSVSTERAIGGLSSSSASKSVNIYTWLRNDGVLPIPNFNISFNVEKYRNGTNSAGFTIQMYYSTDGNNWISAGDDFKVSFIADADNNGFTPAPGQTSSVVDKLLNVSVPVGGDIYFAWNYSVTSGTTTSNAQALGIDDISITANTDTQAPQATFNPLDAATNIEPNVTPTITFDEAIRNIDDSEITDANVASLLTLKETDASGADVPFTATISADKKVITITPSSLLGFNQVYYLAIAPVEDESNNATSAQSITFTTRAASTDATVSSVVYTVDNVAETITNVPSSETLANFKANITPAAGATFEVYESDGSTVATDLQTGYKLTCTAEDGTTNKIYTITLNTAASNDATVSSTVYNVDNVAETITNVPWNETLATFKSNITPAAGATFEVYESDGTTVATDLQSGYKLTCTAEDGTTTKTYTITLNAHITVTSPNGGETFFAGDQITITWTTANFGPTETIKYEAYVRDGLTANWAWEEVVSALPNTGTLDFPIPADATYGTQYKIRLTGNTSGATDESDAAFTVIAVANNINELKAFPDNEVVKLAGEALVTFVRTANRNQKYIQDATGGILIDDNTGKITSTYTIGDGMTGLVGTLSTFTGVRQIVPNGDPGLPTSTGNSIDPILLDYTTFVNNKDLYESRLIRINSLNFTSTGTFAQTTNYNVTDGTNNLQFRTFKTGESDIVGSTIPTEQIDIIALAGEYNGTPQIYSRTLNDFLSKDATLSDLKVDGVTVTGFNPATLTYDVELPYGTTTVPTVTYTLNDAKATAIKTDATALPGSTTVAVTAEDGVTSQTYTINFTIAAPNTEANILTYTVAGVNATIDNVNHTITATVPYTTNITNLVATFTLSDGATAKVGAVDQVSGVTANNFTNPVTYTVTAQNGTTTQDWVVTITKAAEPSHEANITAYSINGVNGVINSGDHTISVTLPYGTNVTNLVATFTLSTNATAKVGGVDQVSGTTPNDFTNPVIYTVTAEDGTSTQDWVVTVTVTPASNAKDITSFTISGQVSSTIDAVAGTVAVVMPYGTNVTALTPTIEVSQYATIDPASGVAQDFTNPVTYTVTAQDNSTKAWTVTVTVAKNTETNILTYSINAVDGTIDNVNHTVAITLPYGTDVTNLVATFTLSGGASAKVGGVDQVSGVTVNNFTNPVVYTVTADDGTTTQDWTVTVTVAQPPLTTLVAWTFPNNPDDATADEGIAENASRVITCTASGTVAYNVAGVTTSAATNTGWDNGVDTKYWMVEFTTKGYKDITVSSAQKASNTGPKDFKLQYQVNSSGTWADVTGASAIVLANDNFISGKIENISLPAECNDADLVALRWVVNSTVAVNGGVVASAGTSRIDDIYIKGKVAALSNDATVTSTVYTVDSNAGTITNVPQTETLANFKANITPAAGATFEVYQADGTTVATDLQTGYKLICTAEDGVTKKTYSITLNTTLSSEKAILSYSINGVNGTIDAVNHTVTLTLPYGTDRSNLVATFTLSAAATAKVGATVQVSGTTANDFTSPVTYTVTAEDGSTQDWVVTVNLTAASTEKDILTFTIAGQVSSTIDAVAGTVTVVMPFGTNVTSLTPTITVSQYATINPASGVAQDFTNPVSYTVTAQDNSTKTWTVTVTVQDIPLTKIYSIQYTTAPSGDSPLKLQQVRTKGVVTAVKTGSTTFNMWLQDSAKAWNGVYVYGVNNSLGTIAQGDSVEVIGTVDEYNNLTEIKSVSYLNKINSGNTLPTPVDVTPAQAASEAYEGVLVKLNNVECTVADAGFGEFTVSDGTNTINVDDFLYRYTPTQGARYNITGVIDYSFGAFKLLPRSANDVESAQVKYTVTFTVKRSDGTTPVDGAIITVTGQGNVTTDASGVATMQLPDGNYSYLVVKDGFDTKNGNFTVSGADLAVNITLIQTGIPANPIAKLSVYPNPFTDRIYFTGAEVTRVTITSVIGQVVMDRQVENTESVDVSSLDRGIYLVRFYNSKGESVLRKLVKEE